MRISFFIAILRGAGTLLSDAAGSWHRYERNKDATRGWPIPANGATNGRRCGASRPCRRNELFQQVGDHLATLRSAIERGAPRGAPELRAGPPAYEATQCPSPMEKTSARCLALRFQTSASSDCVVALGGWRLRGSKKVVRLLGCYRV